MPRPKDAAQWRRVATLTRRSEYEKIMTGKKLKPDPTAEAHVENRRLFNLAVGRLRPEEWEQNHLHKCRMCQGVVYILVLQPFDDVPGDPEKPDASARPFFPVES